MKFIEKVTINPKEKTYIPNLNFTVRDNLLLAETRLLDEIE